MVFRNFRTFLRLHLHTNLQFPASCASIILLDDSWLRLLPRSIQESHHFPFFFVRNFFTLFKSLLSSD